MLAKHAGVSNYTLLYVTVSIYLQFVLFFFYFIFSTSGRLILSIGSDVIVLGVVITGIVPIAVQALGRSKQSKDAVKTDSVIEYVKKYERKR